MSQNTVPFDKEHVQAYLDRCIQFWREQDRDGNVVALDYIDAFQSVRMSLFGELLPQEESSKTRAVELRNEAVKPIQDGVWDCLNCGNSEIGKVFVICPNCETPRPS